MIRDHGGKSGGRGQELQDRYHYEDEAEAPAAGLGSSSEQETMLSPTTEENLHLAPSCNSGQVPPLQHTGMD
ncbi:hypothetical protein BDZ97DRAFT_1865042 [Flammula alnicola]|nr:hypothetical protein BDZ97DRAFT_1865042 [Flammula alnicola]